MIQSMPPWFAAFILSYYSEPHNSNQEITQTLNKLKSLIDQEQTDHAIHEKLRLLHLGHLCFQQQNIILALNHWEEVLEIVSHIPSSIETIFNGIIYIQMASVYLKLNNMSKALYAMERGIHCMESYYPLMHRMFASLYMMYGYYLMQNDKHSEAIECWMKSLKNSYFVNNEPFLAIIYTLLALSSIQSGHIDEAQNYCEQARQYPLPNEISREFPNLLDGIPYFKTIFEQMGEDNGRKFLRTIIKYSQDCLSQILPDTNPIPVLTDEQRCIYEELIVIADHYRHREDSTRAEYYYGKALEKMTETESKLMWNVYQKLMRMNNKANEQYRDYFIEQYSKYDDENPKHFQIIVTLQIIMFQFFLAENELNMAFDCLIR
ncbi:unnamed protein product, partial [Rotaria sordida]